MNTGKTLFAQLIDFLPLKTFGRIVARYDGDSRVRTLSCSEQYRAMAFAQLTYRESLRDIETCLSVQASKLYHMGFSEPVRRSTLADANEARDWRIYAELAQRLIAQARKLYAKEDLGLELANTVYALDSTTIDLCLSVCAGFGESAFPIDGISRNCQPQPYVPQMSRRRLPDRRVAIVVSGRIFAEQKDACERVGADRAIVTALHTKQEILHALTNLQISSHSRLN